MTTEAALLNALETRKRLQSEARAMGITEDYITLLVDAFYGKVRAHPELGPVFDNHIQDHWPDHLARMKLFWNSIALRTGTYRGNPLPVHKALSDARSEHFQIWLDLFKETLVETAPSTGVVDQFMKYATSMADRLSKAMFS